MRPIILACATVTALSCGASADEAADGGAADRGRGPAVSEYRDPAYGSRVRHVRDDGGHEHNLYYYRDCWNADASRMAGVRSDPRQADWRVVLYDADGTFLRELFPVGEFDWKLCWDRKDPKLFYTLKGPDLYSYDVTNGAARLLKSFRREGLKPNGPSLNQAGDRILVLTADGTFRSYRLPDMGDERAFRPEVPAGCEVSWDKPRYIGCRDYIDLAYRSKDPGDRSRQAVVVYDDGGTVVGRFEGVGGGGHYTFSPQGKLAYFKMSAGAQGPARTPLEIRVVNLDGTDDRVVFTVPGNKTAFVQNLHLSWPGGVDDWFVASFFPNGGRLPKAYAPLLDEVVLVRTDGTHKFLARTGTAHSRDPALGRAGDMFWAQPLAVPSRDGRRVCFNSNRAGTIDQYVLYVDP